jgi:alpha-ribazole phosphatase/probable phosphoglycerate mutase
MTINITYFVHGTSLDNETGHFSGWSDVGLSELGIQQSIELKKIIQNKKFDIIFCSDLKRAVESANIIFKDIIPIIFDSRLRECNCEKCNGELGGENYKDVENRIADFLFFLKQNYQNKNVAIVAHGAPQLALDVILKGKTWQQAIDEDWRKTKSWQPGWEYQL